MVGLAVGVMAMLVAGMEEAVIRAALAGMALALLGITLAVVGTAVAATGTAVAGITVVTAAAGELARQSVSVLVLDYSGERSQPLLIMAMTTATITRRMPVRPRQRFGIGATPIRATTLRYPNARFPGSKLFSSPLVSFRPVRDVVKPLWHPLNASVQT
jgi:hypothetical protein